MAETKSIYVFSSVYLTGSSSQKPESLFQSLVLVIAACIVHGVMQGVHDNYGIMMTGLIPYTGIDYVTISFAIGVGAWSMDWPSPFSASWLETISGLRHSGRDSLYRRRLGGEPLCTSPWTLVLFFGLILPFGTTGLCFGIIMGAITPILGEKRAAVVSGIVQASAASVTLDVPGLESGHFNLRYCLCHAGFDRSFPADDSYRHMDAFHRQKGS